MRYMLKNRTTDTVIAEGVAGQTMQVMEGNLYFDPAQVDYTSLIVTDRTYTCPYKGVCNWIDLDTGEGRMQNVGWVYSNPKSGYESIKGQIAFYNRETAGMIVVVDEA